MGGREGRCEALGGRGGVGHGREGRCGPWEGGEVWAMGGREGRCGPWEGGGVAHAIHTRHSRMCSTGGYDLTSQATGSPDNKDLLN